MTYSEYEYTEFSVSAGSELILWSQWPYILFLFLSAVLSTYQCEKSGEGYKNGKCKK